MKFDQYQRESKREPLAIELPDGGTVILPVPDGEVFLAVEEAGGTRKALMLVCGDEWEKLRPLMKTIKDPEMLRAFVKDVMVHFGMAEDDRPPGDGSR